MTLDDLLAPVGAADFFRDTYRQQPLVIPASERRKAVFSYDGLNAILAQASVWTPQTLKLWIDKREVPTARYCSTIMTLDGEALRPDPVKVQSWLTRGASVILNGAEHLTPEFRAVTACLEDALLGYTVANVYFSFGGVQAFDSHYDDHEVFAMHIAGEKKWRVYAGRLDNPVGQPQQGPNAQQMHDRAKGAVLFEHTMQPGELIYIPRGQYHDALASSAASLHVTFSVQPANGLSVFDLLRTEAARDSVFRDDLPRDEAALGERLRELSDRIAGMATNPAFRASVIESQRGRRRPSGEFSLPTPPEDARYAVSGANVSLGRNASGLAFSANGRLTPISEDELPICQWLFAAADFTRREVEAQFRATPNVDVGALLERLTEAGLLRRS